MIKSFLFDFYLSFYYYKKEPAPNPTMNPQRRVRQLERVTRVLLEKLSARAESLGIPLKNELLLRLKKSLADKKEEFLQRGVASDVHSFIEYGRGLIIAIGNASPYPNTACML